ncbi:MAG: 5-formyltetrahydrofolate cyclo-ligase [Deltaproteobacteria bacterium]|nr:5-formyltetrahydrofolate cyclo-ligase [Deltaproteobacteria bacterium]
MREADTKAALRREVKSAREEISDLDRAAWSDAIRRRVAALPVWTRAKVVALYAPIRGEADLLPLVELARAEGKRVVFPRARAAARALEFLEIESAGQLHPGAYGVPEPPDEAGRRVPFPAVELLVLPGLAFDPEGRRLGFGGGYYDRLLAEGGPITIGIAFEMQMRTRLPDEAHDRGVEIVVTEARSLVPGRRNAGGEA